MFAGSRNCHAVVHARRDRKCPDARASVAACSVRAYHLIMSEHTHLKAVLDDVLRLGRALRQQSLTSYNSYAASSTPAKAHGSLDAKTKRTASPPAPPSPAFRRMHRISRPRRCEAGASREEAAETLRSPRPAAYGRERS